MKRAVHPAISLIVLACATVGVASAEDPAIPAFPGAEGAGAYTIGGRGGRVIEVTNLDDAGPGSLRAAVEAKGPRTVVFRVAGTIRLQSPLKTREPHITIAGQTAPGGGIALRDYQLSIDADQVILRFLRVRLGDTTGEDMDAIGSRYHKNIIIDHCSASWSVDECVSVYRSEDVTVQWCLISESLRESVHVKGAHGFGGIWGGKRASYHHNLLAHHSSRNPRISGREPFTQWVDLRNNVIYNWGYNSVYGGEGDVRINLVNNVYKPGPATREKVRARLANPNEGDEGPEGLERWWVAGNVVVGAPDVTTDNWLGVHPAKDFPVDHFRADGPFEIAPVRTDSAAVAYERVLERVGAFLPLRDSHDQRIVKEVASGTATYGGAYGEGSGIIDSQETVGGWPELAAGQPPADADHDGMPDAWEKQYALDPADPADGPADGDEDGYTNLEEFLNATDPTAYVDYGDPANNRFSWEKAD